MLTKGRIHWTQTPKGKIRMAEIQRERRRREHEESAPVSVSESAGTVQEAMNLAADKLGLAVDAFKAAEKKMDDVLAAVGRR